MSSELIQELTFKTLHLAGDLSGSDLADRLGVPFTVIEPGIETMKRDRYCEILSGSFGPHSYVYRLTQAGHSRAAAFAEHNQYVGKLPVPLSQYTEYMKSVASRQFLVTRQLVRQAFSHLVLPDALLDRLGPAIAARHSIFIYGSPGNGKTVISQAIGHLLTGDIAIPHAISVDSEIIRIYDPVNHEALAPIEPPAETLSVDEISDQRWIRCKRPVVTVGGELTIDSLDLVHSSTTGFYRAPLQALANGGVLVIDDFGRQRISPRELLNRWIVPLENRIDHLTLQTGQKFELPFDVLVVFATNLNPLELVDESFLRRIRYKVFADSPTEDEYMQIFQRCCDDHGLVFDRPMLQTFVREQIIARKIALRGCQPRDLIEHVLSLAEYKGLPKYITPELLSAACASYFLADDPEVSK